MDNTSKVIIEAIYHNRDNRSKELTVDVSGTERLKFRIQFD